MTGLTFNSDERKKYVQNFGRKTSWKVVIWKTEEMGDGSN